jgi:DNA-binding PadR family transcriptional regulator
MIRLIGEMTGGAWKPSPGSVYPILRRFEKVGLIVGKWRRSKAAPRRVYRPTGEDRAALPGMREKLISELAAAREIIDHHIRFLQVEDESI